MFSIGRGRTQRSNHLTSIWDNSEGPLHHHSPRRLAEASDITASQCNSSLCPTLFLSLLYRYCFLKALLNKIPAHESRNKQNLFLNGLTCKSWIQDKSRKQLETVILELEPPEVSNNSLILINISYPSLVIGGSLTAPCML